MNATLSAADAATDDLALECAGELIKNIPYVGGVIAAVFSFFTSSAEVITWDDIESYVDEAIDRALLEADVEKAQQDLDNVHSLMTTYCTRTASLSDAERESSKHEYYNDLDNICHDLELLSLALLGREGYPTKTQDGLWHRAPHALLSTVGQMLVLHVAVIREMQAEIYAADAKYLQQKLDDAISAYLAAARALLPAAYRQRLDSLKCVEDARTETEEWYSAGKETYKETWVTYAVEWRDDWADQHATYRKKVRKPDAEGNDTYLAKMSDARLVYQNYWTALNGETTEAMETQVIAPVDVLLEVASESVREAERKQRADSGQVFGGVRCKVEVHADGAHTPAAANVEMTIYVNGDYLVPCMASQKLDHADRESWIWCLGITAEAAIYVRYGLYENGKFDAKWSSTSPLITHPPGSAPVATVKGVNGKYDQLSMTATWLAD